ncbi:MAG: hypothetical protein V9E94_03495 [Microthrixaceae bacterium]
MMPQLTPTHWFSACWPAVAMAGGVPGEAGDGLKGARGGQFHRGRGGETRARVARRRLITPSQPVSGMARPRCSAQATPLTYSTQPASSWRSACQIEELCRLVEIQRVEVTPFGRRAGRRAIQTARSMAMGSTKPSL